MYIPNVGLYSMKKLLISFKFVCVLGLILCRDLAHLGRMSAFRHESMALKWL